jgi:hypothetical protein
MMLCGLLSNLLWDGPGAWQKLQKKVKGFEKSERIKISSIILIKRK